jgi:hypothetical protein
MIRTILRMLAVTAILALAATPSHAQAPFSVCQFSVTQAGVSNSSAAGICPIDPQRMANGAGVSLLLTFSAGANATATVQITGDAQPNVASLGNWNNHDTLINETASANGNLQFPVTAVRVNVTAYVSGTITLTVVQPGLPKS